MTFLSLILLYTTFTLVKRSPNKIQTFKIPSSSQWSSSRILQCVLFIVPLALFWLANGLPIYLKPSPIIKLLAICRYHVHILSISEPMGCQQKFAMIIRKMEDISNRSLESRAPMSNFKSIILISTIKCQKMTHQFPECLHCTKKKFINSRFSFVTNLAAHNSANTCSPYNTNSCSSLVSFSATSLRGNLCFYIYREEWHMMMAENVTSSLYRRRRLHAQYDSCTWKIKRYVYVCKTRGVEISFFTKEISVSNWECVVIRIT